MADFTTLESLYTRGVLDINGKDFINGTNSTVQVNSQRDTFLPDSRFVKVDGPYMRNCVDRDTFMLQGQNYSSADMNNSIHTQNGTQKKMTTKDKIKNFVSNKTVAAIVGSLALLFSGRYILKKLHFIK